MTVLGLRAIIWTFPRKPYQRPGFPSSTYTQLLLNATDLSFNFRGIGWSWAHKQPAESPSSFTFILISFHFHAVLFDVTLRLIQNFDPNTIGSPIGGTIFDPTLPPLLRYSRSSLITLLAGLAAYAVIQSSYLFCTLFSLIFLFHSPSQWPPLFNHPWFSTSVSQLWSSRWHQLFSHIFVSAGNTLTPFMGRVGGVLGAFFLSGVLHTLGLWGMDRGGEFIKVTGFFMMMGVGTLVEYSWKNITGSRVDGFLGRIWTIIWILGWGNIFVDASTTKGLVGTVFFPDGYRPSDYILWWIRSYIG